MAPSDERSDIPDDAIAIIGMAGRFPGARNLRAFWTNLRNGVDSVTRFPYAESVSLLGPTGPVAPPNFVGAEGLLDDIEYFDHEFFGFSLREARWTDPQQRIFLECAWAALEDAGYDSERLDAPTAVYAGAGKSLYVLSQISRIADDPTAAFEALSTGSAESLATRTSYKLDLRGESMVVYTACSSSLVTVHLACQSLLTGQADVALAGGVQVSVPQKSGYLFEEGMILSPDGYCRPFDRRASGTVFGSGVGLVVLKPLAAAIDAGDHVYAVIRGSAINNDGRAKVGYTAPSVDGQADVLAKAYAAANVDPRRIGMLEAHGTATKLGDPIEVAALRRVFGGAPRDGSERCALGSVKSNIGHLNAAAGIAGLVKAALALHHEEIPPSLHFEQPNPEIDLANTSFAVSDRLRPWKQSARSRFAGISSFGIGGTNAHVVLQDAPPRRTSPSKRRAHLVTLAARTPAALDRMATDLAEHLTAHPDASLADIAHTRLEGRRAFAHRRAFAARTVQDATEALRKSGVGAAKAEREPKIVFVFPGQGAQSVEMAKGLYDSEPVFRDAIDRCATLARAHYGSDLRDVLFPPAARREAAAREIATVRSMLPTLFAVEYALAQLWISWGVKPSAVVGLSFGEYVAACLAGVFALEDALRVVVARGALMQTLPPGAMLAVALPIGELEPLLCAGVSIATIGSRSSTVVSGDPAAIEAQAVALQERGIESQRLDVPIANHSAMVEPILAEFTGVLRSISRKPPSMPCMSNLSGTWMTDADATDPAYWSRHMRSPVRFAADLDALAESGHTVFVEVGPGNSATSLIRQHLRDRKDVVAIATLRRARESGDDVAFFTAAGELWSLGVPVDLARIYANETRSRASLPSYPFERVRCWLEPNTSLAMPVGGAPVASDASTEVATTGASSRTGDALESDTERKLADLWRQLLGVDPIFANDDFLDLGGHSLLGTRLAARIREVFGVPMTLRVLFEQPTVRAIAAKIDASTEKQPDRVVALPTIEPDPAHRHEPFPLTDVQQAYWIGRSHGLELGEISTQGYREFEVRGLDLARFERALQRLVARHDMLRAVVLADGTQVVQRDTPPYRIAVGDLRGLSSEVVDARLAVVRDEMMHADRPTDRWPLFEVRAHRLDEDRTRVHLVVDYLLVDAWSVSLLGRDLLALYLFEQPPLPELALTFRDYVLAELRFQSSESYAHSLGYWRDRIAQLPAAPELPLAINPAALHQPRFRRYAGELDRERWKALQARAGRAGLTGSGVVLAAFAEVLGAWSKNPRFTINVTTFNRLAMHPQVNEIIGDFTSLTLLAVDQRTGARFTDRARAIQQRLFEDLEHRHVSGVRVVREMIRSGLARSTSANMPVVFTSTLTQRNADSVDAELPAGAPEFRVVDGLSQTAQVWLDHQVGEEAGALRFNWDVIEELFPERLVADMFAAYGELLRALATDDGAWSRTERASLPGWQRDTRRAANATDAPIPSGLLHQPFERAARERPDAVAVITPSRTVTYGQLATYAYRVGSQLRARGVRPGELVAVVSEKGWEQVAAVLAILVAGGAYVPIDAGLPPERIAHLLTRTDARIAVTQPRVDSRVEWPVAVDRIVVRESDLDGETPPALDAVQKPDDLAYVIFTSGSTGTPKGVMIDHRGALNTVIDVNERLRVTPADRVLGLSALNFDLSVWDIFGVLGAGGAVVYPTPEGIRDPAEWTQLLHSARVTLWNTVPALLQMLVDFAEAQRDAIPSTVRAVMMSGDWIPVSLPDRFRALRPDAAVFGLGGATEASIWSIWFPIDAVSPEWKSIPYGKPMLNQQFHVFDETFEPSPVWVPGQLFIGGIGLAKGYWRDTEKTDAAFVTHPRTGERLYRTGDLGRYLPDGNIEFLGREDTQVKVQGFRIELGEIEAALVQHTAVRDAAVAAVGPSQGTRRLVGYVVLTEAASDDELRAFLAKKLPEYMVPGEFVHLESLPLSANGKVDRKALPAPDSTPASHASEEFVAPRDAIETQIAKIFEDVLDVRPVGLHTDFFRAGGDSIRSVRVIAQIQQRMGRSVRLATLLERPTVAAIADNLRAVASETSRSPIVRLQSTGSLAPLHFVHAIGGSALPYTELAQRFAGRRPFLAYQAPGGERGEQPIDRVESLARLYVDALLGAQPRGPYYVGGWSFGGLVALEMGRLLRESGRDVRAVLLVDSYIEEHLRAFANAPVEALVDAFAIDLADQQRSIGAAVDPDAIRQQLLARDHVSAEAAQMQRWFDVFCAHLRATAAYRPPPYDGRAVLYRAADSREELVRNWHDVLSPAFGQHVVAGNHYTILQGERAAQLARLLDADAGND